MYNKVLLLLACFALGSCKDLAIGSEGKLIYNETVQANPALWRRDDNVTIATNNSEIISKIVVTDLREEKDGNIEIVEGGQGHTNVTFEVQSPSVLRGYEFHIEVYAMSSDNENGSTEVKSDAPSMDVNVPAVIGKSDYIRSPRTMKHDEQSLNIPKTTEEPTTERSETETTTSSDNEEQDKNIKKVKDDAENHQVVDLILDMNDQSEKAALRSENLKLEETTTIDDRMESTTFLNDEMTASTPGFEKDVEKEIEDFDIPAIFSKMEPKDDKVYSNEWNRQDSRFEVPRMQQLRNQKIIK